MENKIKDPFGRNVWSGGRGSLASLTPEQMAMVVGFVRYHTSAKGFIYADGLLADLKDAYNDGKK
jgi:hypothetical protein